MGTAELAHPASGGHVLRKDDAFAILDEGGDIRSDLYADHGFYLNDCRHLSRYELRLGAADPLLLASNLSHDGALLIADLANSEIQHMGSQPAIAREQIHVLRQTFLWKDVLHQQLRIRSFSAQPVWLMLQYTYDADFCDMFEIRGSPRSQRGRAEPVQSREQSVELAYVGLDERRRSTTLVFDPLPLQVTPTATFYQLQVLPGQRLTLRTSIILQQGNAKSRRAQAHVRMGEDYRALRRQLRHDRSVTPALRSSNELFNQWLRRSVSDLHLLLSTTRYGIYPYAGIPWFNTAFGRDGLITALQSLEMEPRIARGVLTFLAATQANAYDAENEAAPGKTLHERRHGEMATLKEVPFGKYYGSVDSTPLFVMLAGAYFKRSADRKLVKSLWPHVKRALEWIDTTGDADNDGFVEYHRSGDKGLRNQGWKDSEDSIMHADGSLAEGAVALCEVQGYVYAAKRSAAELAIEFDSAELAERLSSEADKLLLAFDENYWDNEQKIYALALDGDKNPCRVTTSNAGQVLFSRLVLPQRTDALIDTLRGPAMSSGWGIRTLSSDERRFSPLSYHNGSIWPHDNTLIAMGMAAYGYRNEPMDILSGLYEAALFMPLQRLPELFCGFTKKPGRSPVEYAESCRPQAWSSASAYGLLCAILGLSIDAAKRQVRIKHPVLPPYIEYLELTNLQVGDAAVDLLFERTHTGATTVVPTHFSGAIELVVSA